MSPRPIVSVIGSAGAGEDSKAYATARALGTLLVDAGYRVMTGGLGGIMEAACRGAHDSTRYREGDTLGILPQADPAHANPYADIVLATGLDHGRNMIVANADAVIAIDGGAGTLSEIAFAWMFKRLIIGIDAGGWSSELGDRRLDHRTRSATPHDDRIFAATSAEEAMAILGERLGAYAGRHRGIKARSREG